MPDEFGVNAECAAENGRPAVPGGHLPRARDRPSMVVLRAQEASLAAVYPDARNPFAHPELLEEGYEPWTVLEVWMMAAPSSNHWVDITDALPRKLDALRSHVSQHTDADGLLEDRMRGWGAMLAQQAGFPEGRLAEGFFVIDTAG